MELGLNGKRIVVTGATGGLGRRICKSLTREGAIVAGVYHPDFEEVAEELYDEINGSTYEVDITSGAEVHNFFRKKVGRDMGDVYGLVNCAAVLEKPVTRPEDWDMDEAKRVMDVNYFGAARCVKYAAPYLRKTRGAIVNVLGVGARQGDPVAPYYGVSKAALANATKAWAREFEGEVRVMGIYPAMMKDTPMFDADIEFAQMAVSKTLIKEPLNPEDVADFIVTMLSPKFKGLNGSNVEFDDGLGW